MSEIEKKTRNNKIADAAVDKLTEQVKSTTKNGEKKETGTVIYIGPTIPGAAAMNTIFNNGITEELEKVTKEMPALASLIVPIEKASKARGQLSEPDSPVRICFEKALEYIGRREKK